MALAQMVEGLVRELLSPAVFFHLTDVRGTAHSSTTASLFEICCSQNMPCELTDLSKKAVGMANAYPAPSKAK